MSEETKMPVLPVGTIVLVGGSITMSTGMEPFSISVLVTQSDTTIENIYKNTIASLEKSGKDPSFNRWEYVLPPKAEI